MANGGAIAFERVTKRYPSGLAAVRDLDLRINAGEALALTGASGSGKTTVLRLLAGLEPVTTGRIRIGERDVTGLAPRERDVALVSQTYALYPHLSVFDNLAFALKLGGVARPEIAVRVNRAATLLQIVPLLPRTPRELSSGERQRAAIGRVLARSPRVILLDEPLSTLDAELRLALRQVLRQVQRELGATLVYVTNDRDEAVAVADRVAVMRDGGIHPVA